ncbi:hypothetical protein ACIQ57_16860 [Lysinibacillus xylanilyticus]|uniref:hypothetical protein n=1 Tax=Lysinibacillus xylanilyticus TaxID=582475 RepID=UPI00381A1615
MVSAVSSLTVLRIYRTGCQYGKFKGLAGGNPTLYGYVHDPGLPKKGRHLTLSPLKDATGKLTGNFELKSADVATSKLTSKQMNQISSQVTYYLQTDGNLKKLSETAKGSLDKGGIKDPKRIQQLKDVSSVLDDHIKNGTKPKCL